MNSNNRPKRVEKQSSTASNQSDREVIRILQEDDQELAEAKIRQPKHNSLTQERVSPPPPPQAKPAARQEAVRGRDVARMPKEDDDQELADSKPKAKTGSDHQELAEGKPRANSGNSRSKTDTEQEDQDAKEKAKAMSHPTQQYANRSQALAANYAFRDSQNDILEDINNLPPVEENRSSDFFTNETVLTQGEDSGQNPVNRSLPEAPFMNDTESQPGAFRVGTSFTPAETSSVSEASEGGGGDEGIIAPTEAEPSQVDEEAVSPPSDDTGTGDILVEATLVVPTEDPPEKDPQENVVIPEPELVTAEPVSETDTHRYGPSEMIKNRYGRLWVLGFIAAVLMCMIVVSVVIGVTLNRKNNNSDPVVTEAPTMAPTSFLEDVLPEATQLAVATNGTSQFKAYEWHLEDQDYINSQEGSNSSNTISYVPIQRFALASFYYATNGNTWNDGEYWLDHDQAECDWATSSRASICNPSLPVRQRKNLRRALQADFRPYYNTLALTQNNIIGTLPPEIALLSHLDVFNVGYNFISGTLPTELGRLEKVTVFQILQNGISGPIPSEFGMMPSLRELILSFNWISGTIPSELGLAPSLKVLGASHNLLEGTIPTEVGNLSNLESMFLYGNAGLTGPIPSEVGLLTSLARLWLYSSNHTDQLPSELGLLTSIEEIVAANNSLSGTIPSELGLATSLKILSAASNLLEGTIPSELGNLTNLEGMYLFGNSALTGPLPSELGLLTSLTYLQLYSANHTGQLPSELGLLTNMEEIDLHDNWNLRGSIPESWTNLTNLMRLFLYNTDLTGTIPEGLCNASLEAKLVISVDCGKVFCNCSCDCVSNASRPIDESDLVTSAPNYYDDDLIVGPDIFVGNGTSANDTNGFSSGSWSADDGNVMNYTDGYPDDEPLEIERLSEPAPAEDATAPLDREHTTAELPPTPSDFPPEFYQSESFDESEMDSQQSNEAAQPRSSNIFDHT